MSARAVTEIHAKSEGDDRNSFVGRGARTHCKELASGGDVSSRARDVLPIQLADQTIQQQRSQCLIKDITGLSKRSLG